MAIFTIEYTYADDDAGRDRVREEHRDYLKSHPAVLLAGPYRDFPAGALIVVRAEDEEQVQELVTADPFHRDGLIAEFQIRSYEPVLGSQAAAFGE